MAFVLFGEFKPNSVTWYPQVAEFVESVRAAHGGRLRVPDGPVLEVFDGIDFLTQLKKGFLVDERMQPVERINNIPFLHLFVSPDLRRRDQTMGGKFWLFIDRLEEGKVVWSDEGDISFFGSGPIIGDFDFNDSFLKGRGPVPIKPKSLKAWTKQQLEVAYRRGEI